MVPCSILFALVNVCQAETYYLQKSGTDLVTSGAFATSGGVPCSEIISSDAYVCEGKCLTFRIVAATGGTFSGGSLSIGSANGMGAGLLSQSQGAVLVFPDYGTVECGGLILKNGVLATADAAGRHDVLRGKITVEATSAMPFMIVDKRGYLRNKGWSIVEIGADFHGAAGSVIEFGSVFQYAVDGLVDGSKGTTTNTTLLLTGTFNNFYGTLAVTNKLQTALISTLGVLNSYGSKLKLDTDSVFSGKMVVNGGSVLECATAGKEYSIGALEMRSGSVLVLNGSTVLDSRKVPSSTSCASLRVSGACQIVGPVMVAMPGCSVAADGMTNRVAILTVPTDVELDPNDFVLAGCGSSYVPNRFVVKSGVDGSKTLFCEFEPYAMLIASDNKTTNASGDYPSAITNGTSWSTGVAQAPHVNYVVTELNESKMYLRSLRVREGSMYVSEFNGKRLIIANGGVLYPDCVEFRSARNPLRILDGGNIVSIRYRDVKFIGGVELYRGNALMTMYTNDFEIDVLTGSGTFYAGTGQSSNNRDFRGTYSIYDTEGFTGTFFIQQATAPKPAMYQTLYVCGNALGGALDEFNPAAVWLTDESALSVDLSSPTQRLENVVNRGVFVDGCGRVRLVNEYEQLCIDWPLTMNGELWKEGSGTLVLGGECRFGSDSTVAPSAEVVADILLKEGTLAVASPSAVDGCRLSISNGTKIVVAYASDNNALLAYGLRNVKTAEPFELCDVEDGKLPLVMDFSGWGGAMPDVLEVGLVTVTNQAGVVEAVRSMMTEKIKMLGTRSFYKVKMSEAANADDNTFTFKARLTKVGFTVVIR